MVIFHKSDAVIHTQVISLSVHAQLDGFNVPWLVDNPKDVSKKYLIVPSPRYLIKKINDRPYFAKVKLQHNQGPTFTRLKVFSFYQRRFISHVSFHNTHNTTPNKITYTRPSLDPNKRSPLHSHQITGWTHFTM